MVAFQPPRCGGPTIPVAARSGMLRAHEEPKKIGEATVIGPMP